MSDDQWRREWRSRFLSEPPKITLEGRTRIQPRPINGQKPVLADDGKNEISDLQLAAARTCYSPRVINSAEITNKQRETIPESTFKAGHHTIYQHGTLNFGFEGISRHLTWNFLHSHPFYNSEQSSQRFVHLKPGGFVEPQFRTTEAQQIFAEIMAFSHQTYEKLCSELLPVVTEEYHKRFPHRPLDNAKAKKDIAIKSQEIARYINPIGAGTSMVHSLTPLVLARYYRTSRMPGTSLEGSLVVEKMVSLAAEYEPDFFKLIDGPLSDEELLEADLYNKKFVGKNGLDRLSGIGNNIAEFDMGLKAGNVELVDYSARAEQNIADAVRTILGLTKFDMRNEQALELVLNPAINRQLGDALVLTTHSPISRALNHATYTFKKKISHTASSQDQRHRMTPGSAPIFDLSVPIAPDYITPALFAHAPDQVQETYHLAIKKIWDARNRLIELDEDVANANLALPNATSIRLLQSNPLIYFMHKAHMRTCLNAQEEVWRSTLGELAEISAIHPNIGKNLGAPCESRKMAGVTPYCPEGDRYCGVPIYLSRSNRPDKDQWRPIAFIDKRTI